LTSLNKQTLNHFKLVVQDGNSRDDTLKKIRNIYTRNISISSNADAGIYDALNQALERCDGDIVGFLHSDDHLPSANTLEKIAGAFDDPSIVAVFGNVKISNNAKVIRYWKSSPYSLFKSWIGWMPPHVAFYCRKEIYNEVGNFDINFRVSGDYHWFLRFFRYLEANPDKGMRYLKEDICNMKVGGASSSGVSSRWIAFWEDYRACKLCGVSPFPRIIMKRFMKLNQWLYSG